MRIRITRNNPVYITFEQVLYYEIYYKIKIEGNHRFLKITTADIDVPNIALSISRPIERTINEENIESPHISTLFEKKVTSPLDYITTLKLSTESDEMNIELHLSVLMSRIFKPLEFKLVTFMESPQKIL